MTHPFFLEFVSIKRPTAHILQDASSFCQSSMIHDILIRRLRLDDLFMLGPVDAMLDKVVPFLYNSQSIWLDNVKFGDDELVARLFKLAVRRFYVRNQDRILGYRLI